MSDPILVWGGGAIGGTMAAYWVESDQRCRIGGLLGVAVGALLVWAGLAVY